MTRPRGSEEVKPLARSNSCAAAAWSRALSPAGARGDAGKSCLRPRASYLATGEDERRCDDLRLFDKSVFHLVGERRKGGRRRGSRGGGEGRCEGDGVSGRRADEERQHRAHQRPPSRAALLTRRDCVFLSEPKTG